MKRNIITENDLRSWLFEAEEAPAGGAPAAGGDKKVAAPDPEQAKEVEKLWNEPYPQFVEDLRKKIKEPGFKEILAAGKEDGTPGDELFNPQPATPAANGLSPTQSEIDLGKSVGWCFSHPGDVLKMLNGGPWKGGDPIVISGNKVIDGHHRWSSVFVVDPTCTLECVDISAGEADMSLKLTQAAIAIKKGTIPFVKVDPGMNIYKLSFEQILDLFAKPGGPASMPRHYVESCLGAGLKITANPQQIGLALRKFKAANPNSDQLFDDAKNSTAKPDDFQGYNTIGGAQVTKKDAKNMAKAAGARTAGAAAAAPSGQGNLFKEQAAPAAAPAMSREKNDDYPNRFAQVAATVANNCKSLPAAGDYSRNIMPQTGTDDGGPGIPDLKATLSSGEINSKPGFDIVKEGRLVYGFERRSSLPGIRRRY